VSAFPPAVITVPRVDGSLTRIDFTPTPHACSVCGGKHGAVDPRGIPVANYPHPNRAQRRGRR
jgi:hypothetical protein